MINPYELRKDFPMLREKRMMQDHELVFLDNASTTFKPDCVIDAVNKYLSEETSNSHRGDYDLCYNADQKILKARENVASLINANVNEVVFTSGTTMSLNLVAYGYALYNLKENDEILISEAEHASNVLPWFRVAELTKAKIRYVSLDEEGRITVENVKKAITNRTKIISLAFVGNVLGYMLDVKEIAKVCHEHGVIVAIDGAQAVPHMEIDVKDLDIDFLSFSGHKMCASTGVGILYGKYELLEKMEPVFTGGGMNARFHLDGSVTYLHAPEKFEAGTINIEGIYSLDAAITYLKRIGLKNIDEYEKELRTYAVSRLKEVPNIIIYNENADAGIITFNIKGVFAQDEATYLNSKGFALRSGQHCAKMLDGFLKEFATVRCSIYFYTTKEEIDSLVETLKKGDNFLDAYFA